MLEDKKGEMFFPLEKGRVDIKKKTHMLNQKYNALTEYQPEARKEILKQILGELNENVVLQGPITFHYGVHTKIGKNTFINFNFTCQDDGEVTIGENCDFGPNVTIVTPIHPMLPGERKALLCPDGVARKGYAHTKPVSIGNNCWICANVTILPGVTVGDRLRYRRGQRCYTFHSGKQLCGRQPMPRNKNIERIGFTYPPPRNFRRLFE